MEYVKIAEDRVGAVIGKEGDVKSRIESELEVSLSVDSLDGMVQIENKGDDPLGEWKARDVVRAISYGIDPDAALQLKKDDHVLIVLNLLDIVGRSKKAVARQKARIIGRRGKTRAYISELTGAAISIKGKHVAIIGRNDEAAMASDAVEAIAGGLPHGVVYKALEKRRANMRMQENVEMWGHR